MNTTEVQTALVRNGWPIRTEKQGIVRAALTYIERDRVQEATNEHR